MELACEFVDVVDRSITSYREIIKFIRKSKMDQKAVKAVLVGQAGMVDSQCSQIFRVATAPQDVFDKYISETLGFNAALREARNPGQTAQLTDAQKTAKIKNRFLAAGHMLKKPFATVEDTDFLLVIPGAIKDKEQFREETFVASGYEITVRKAEK